MVEMSGVDAETAIGSKLVELFPNLFFVGVDGSHRELHVLTHSFPTRRSSDLAEVPQLAALADGNRSLLLAARRQRRQAGTDRKSTRLNSSHSGESRMPSSA